MNCIETVKHIIMNFPDIDEFSGGIHVDYLNDNEGEMGLFSVGDVRVSEDILGNETRRMDFILYATCQSMSEYERLINSSFITNLAFYLDNIHTDDYEITIGTNDDKGELRKITCSNGMLYRYLNDTQNGPVQYQLQISATYKIYK